MLARERPPAAPSLDLDLQLQCDTASSHFMRNLVSLFMRWSTTTEPMKTTARPITTTGSLRKGRNRQDGRALCNMALFVTHTFRPGVSSLV